MANVLNFFGYFRAIPEETYSFYSYYSYSFITKKRPESNHRTLNMLQEFLGFLTQNNADAFSPSFKKST